VLVRGPLLLLLTLSCSCDLGGGPGLSCRGPTTSFWKLGHEGLCILQVAISVFLDGHEGLCLLKGGLEGGGSGGGGGGGGGEFNPLTV